MHYRIQYSDAHRLMLQAYSSIWVVEHGKPGWSVECSGTWPTQDSDDLSARLLGICSDDSHYLFLLLLRCLNHQGDMLVLWLHHG